MSDALEEAFPLAIHLRCFRHFRCNLQIFLSTLSATTTHEYFYEIFGKQEGNVYQEGLPDAVADDDFDARLLSLRDSWARRVKCSADDCKLYDSSMMKSCMIASVRTKPGLGNPPFHLNFTPMTARTLTGACETRRKHLITISCSVCAGIPAQENLFSLRCCCGEGKRPPKIYWAFAEKESFVQHVCCRNDGFKHKSLREKRGGGSKKEYAARPKL